VPRKARRPRQLGKRTVPSAYVAAVAAKIDARDDEDERRQPERVDGGEAERVVDRGADVAVGGGEERRRAEHRSSSTCRRRRLGTGAV
jgi:hypothetical protein